MQAAFEQRPAMLVQRLLKERGLRTDPDDRGIRELGGRVVPGQEQDFAAAKLALVEVPALGVGGNEPVQHLQRQRRFAERLVCARELIQDLVRVLVVGVRLEQPGI